MKIAAKKPLPIYHPAEAGDITDFFNTLAQKASAETGPFMGCWMGTLVRVEPDTPYKEIVSGWFSNFNMREHAREEGHPYADRHAAICPEHDGQSCLPPTPPNLAKGRF